MMHKRARRAGVYEEPTTATFRPGRGPISNLVGMKHTKWTEQ